MPHKINGSKAQHKNQAENTNRRLTGNTQIALFKSLSKEDIGSLELKYP